MQLFAFICLAVQQFSELSKKKKEHSFQEENSDARKAEKNENQ
jgi:hypothetical protein